MRPIIIITLATTNAVVHKDITFGARIKVVVGNRAQITLFHLVSDQIKISRMMLWPELDP